MAKITGRVNIRTSSGIDLLNKSGAKATGIGKSGDIRNFELEPIMGDGGIHGFKENPITAGLEVTITDRDDVALGAIALIGDDPEDTVQYTSANGGKSYTLRNATCVRNFDVTAGEGETTIKFVGSAWIEDL